MNIVRLCCVKRRLDLLPSIESIDSVARWTKECFNEQNITAMEQFKYVLFNFYNESSQFNEKVCVSPTNMLPTAAVSDASTNENGVCNDPMSIPNTIYVAVWALMLTLIVCSNIVVILAMRKSSFKSNNTSLLLSSLAVSDLLVGIFIIPIKIKFTLHNQRFCLSDFYCKLYITADNTFFSASITNLFVICIDKYIALNYPYKYPVWMSRKKAKVLLVLAWCNGIFWGILSNIKFDNIHEPASHISGYQCSFNENYIYTTLVSIIVFLLPALIMGKLYHRILTIAKFHARGISESVYYNNNFKTSDELCDKYKTILTGEDKGCILTKFDERRGSSLSLQYDLHRPSKLIQILYYKKMVLKASKTVAIVYGTFVVCWLPVMCWSMLNVYCRSCIRDANMLFYIILVEILPIFNSMLNPFIYALTNRQFRNAFKEVLLLKKLKN